jgi:uncharacterized protein YraI
MRCKIALLSAASAFILSAGAAAAAPAVTESSVNLRAGPGTQYQVVDTIPGGTTVDVAGCTGSWCRVNFSGQVGYASRNYLQLAGGPAPGAGVVVAAPGYVYGEPIYDYYDDGYTYGPSFGFYASPSFRHRHGWRGRHRWDGNRIGTWQGRGNWSGGRTGNWQGSGPVVGGQARGSGFAGPPAGWQRPGTGIGAGAGSGFAGGGGAGASASAGGGAAAPSAPAGGGAQSGFAGSIVRGGR